MHFLQPSAWLVTASALPGQQARRCCGTPGSVLWSAFRGPLPGRPRGEIMLGMAAWEEFGSPGLAVWCDKTAVLGALAALRGEMLTGPGLLDAVALVDAVVWFDRVVVDASLDTAVPAQVADALVRRPLQPAEYSQLRQAVEETWNERDLSESCKQFWRRYFAEPGFDFRLSQADFHVDSAHTAEEFSRSLDRADVSDLAGPGSALLSRRQEQAAYSTVRALSGGLVAAQLGMFHMPTAVRRGLLGWFQAPCQVTSLIAVEPVSDGHWPSAFGRVTDIQMQRQCGVWDAVATVRHELEPARRVLRGCAGDPSRIRLAEVRDALGFGRPELQAGLGLSLAFLSGGLARNLRSRRVAVVQRLERAADTLAQAADDLCRLTGTEMPVISPKLAQLTQTARRLSS